MKKLFAVIALIAVSIASYGQHTSTRSQVFGTTDASSISFLSKTLVDTAGATVDTVELRPNANIMYVKFNAVDSSTIRLKSNAGAYYGDILTIDIVNPTITGNFVYLFGNWIVSTGTKKISLTSAKSSLLKFQFDGANWVEISRNLNYTR